VPARPTTARHDISHREFAALWLLAFAAASAIGTHGIAYWDAGDYTLLAITGGKSGMLLGRPLFLWVSRLVLLTGVDPASAEPVLRWFWTIAGTLAAPLLAVLATRLGLERRPALVAGIALALSPSFAHTSHQVLTDAPALALSIAALASAASNRAWLAGVLLAAAIATRETAAVHVVSMALLLGQRRGLLAIAISAAAVLAIVITHQPPGVLEWFTAMSRSVSTHHWSIVDLLTSVAWVIAAGPTPVIAGFVMLVRRNVSPRVMAVSAPAAIFTVFLLFYPDGGFSPRYVLATVPLAFFIAAAPWLAARRMLAAVLFVVPIAIAAVAVTSANAVADYGASVGRRIPELPQNATVVPGHFCPQSRLAAAVAGRLDLRFICPGWEWPSDVAAELDAAANSGRPVAMDLTDAAWVGRREVEPRNAVRSWAETKPHSDEGGFRIVRR